MSPRRQEVCGDHRHLGDDAHRRQAPGAAYGLADSRGWSLGSLTRPLRRFRLGLDGIQPVHEVADLLRNRAGNRGRLPSAVFDECAPLGE
jgi:hypothetical protein